MATRLRNIRLVAGFIVGTSAIGGSAWLYHNKNSLLQAAKQGNVTNQTTFSPLGSVLASWTTNFTPTVEWDHNWDRRSPCSVMKPTKDEKNRENELQKATPVATRHLIFIRHGQYNLDGDKDPQRYLTSLGREQAELTGQRLQELNTARSSRTQAEVQYTSIVSSTLTRAMETADIIACRFPKVDRHKCDLLCEGAPIPPEPPIGHWRPEPEFFQDGARIEAAFRQYFYRASPKQENDSYEIIVCHANVIRYFVCRALQLPPEAWLRMSLHHSSITWFSIRPSGRVSLQAVGDAGFIPADKLSFS